MIVLIGEKMSKNIKWILTIVGILAVLLSLAFMFWGWYSGWSRTGWGYMGPGMMDGFGGGWFMGLGMLIIGFLIIWGIVALVQGNKSTSDSASSSHPDSALEILRKRYASGELTKDEFEQKRKDLE
jgi:putative membrane protein